MTARLTSLLTTLLPADRGRRRVALSSFVHSGGTGLSVAAGALFFTRVVGLPAGQVATGLLASAITGLASGVYVGRLADRFGAARVQIIVSVLGAAINASLLLVHSFASYLLVSMLSGAVIAASWTTLAPLVRGFGGETPAAFRAYLRSVGNLAMALGAVAAGFAIQLDTAAAYYAVMIARSLTYLLSGLLLYRLPPFPATAAAEAAEAPEATPDATDGRRRAALRDRRYLAATAANAVMSLHFAVPTFLLPLWIEGHTSAPRWTISASLVLNTVLVVALQVRLSRNVGDVPGAGRAMRRAGLALAPGLALMALASGPSAWLAVLCLAVGMAVYTLGEIWHTAASAEYSFGLAPADSQGEYAGVFHLGQGLSDAVSPIILSAVPLALGIPGWLGLAALLLLTGLTAHPLILRAQARPLVGQPA
ncbi:MFS transporter [Streptomyces sp. NPDC020807]|uniref:MFS transporter n=1 Tax=Streptomyces sp. NPDC020807 TaxID=3155119 RepID=UPI0033C5437B